MAPADENECRQMLYTGDHSVLALGGALSARHGTRRGVAAEMTALPVGRAHSAARRPQRPGDSRVRRTGRIGAQDRRTPRCNAGQHALRQAAGRETGDCRWRRRHRAIVTIEENAIIGGAGSGVGELLAVEGRAIAAAAYRHTRSLHRARLARHLSRRRRDSISRGLPPASSTGGRSRIRIGFVR